MKINEIIERINARAATSIPADDFELEKAFSSDLMSDVLTLEEENILLITGLANVQLIRTAEMADIDVVVLARGKKASPEMVELASENGLVILETPFSIYKTSGILYSNGLKPVF
ncbi:MAG: hypothetical protein ACQETJ_00825 [Bacteroidota bacterium]